MSEKKNFNQLRDNVKIFEQKTNEEFNEYFIQYYPKLTFYINNICKDEALAEDLAVDTFIQALTKIELYDETKPVKFITWLFTIGKNIVLQEIRTKNFKCISLDRTVSNSSGYRGNPGSESSIKDFLQNSQVEDDKTLEQEKITKIKHKIAINNIKKLNQPFRKVIEMREIDCLSYKEIATELGEDVTFELVSNEDSKIKLPTSLSKITNIIDIVTGDTIENDVYSLTDGGNLNPFYTHIKLPMGKYKIEAREPYNLSTLKSQIRNGRKILKKMSKHSFNNVISDYGDI